MGLSRRHKARTLKTMTGSDETQLEAIRTADGSITLRRLDLDCSYRSTAGAWGESDHVFIQPSGLSQHPSPWRVLELGSGLGTNLTGLVQAARRAKVALDYLGLEAEPIPPDQVPQDLSEKALVCELLTAARRKKQGAISQREGLKLQLIPQRWQDTNTPAFAAHAIFHDPFGPSTNPDCWGREVFLWEKAHLAPDGLIVTYGAAGHVRRAMRDAGLYVAQGPGYGPKREMTLAALNEEALEPYRLKYRP